MKNLLLVTAVICSALVAVRANPVPEARPDPEPKTDIELMKIPLEGDKELDVITLVDSGDQKINERNKRTIGILRELFPTISQITTNENLNTLESLDLAGLSDAMNAIRVARATDQDIKSVGDADDQNGAESSAKSSALDELTLDSEGNDEDRNKRFLSFGGSSGGAGGSGNFLFDIIRLVSGSSGTEQSDEKANSPDDHELGKGDGYTEGIPGPVTRLFVLANRGLSNLIQDLILCLLSKIGYASLEASQTLPSLSVQLPTLPTIIDLPTALPTVPTVELPTLPTVPPVDLPTLPTLSL